MKAIGYIRVSTASQAEDGISLDAQRAKIEAWCLANDAELLTVHVDAGLSGKRADNRPALQDALAAACESGGVLVVYSLSRLARSTRDTIDIAERLERAGADLVSLSEKIDTTSAAGKMLFRLLAVLAEFERDLISERTKGALQHKRSKGERVSGKIPFGFTLAANGVDLVEVPGEIETVRTINEMRQRGHTLRAIADHLNRTGVATKAGGKPWLHSTVAGIVNRSA